MTHPDDDFEAMRAAENRDWRMDQAREDWERKRELERFVPYDREEDPDHRHPLERAVEDDMGGDY